MSKASEFEVEIEFQRKTSIWVDIGSYDGQPAYRKILDPKSSNPRVRGELQAEIFAYKMMNGLIPGIYRDNKVEGIPKLLEVVEDGQDLSFIQSKCGTSLSKVLRKKRSMPLFEGHPF